MKDKGWLQTDGSDSTLQYGRKISETAWEYREWVDDGESISIEEKLEDWDSSDWREEVIDLNDYTEDEIWDALSVYGYTADILNVEDLTFHQSGDTYTGQDAVQLACECLFELQ